MTTGVSFDDLVTVATVGVSRKGFSVSELAGPAAGNAGATDAADPAAALLDAAALLTVARRAGVRPVPCAARAATGGAAGQPRGARSERELPATAARLLRRLGHADQAPGFAAGDAGLVADLLGAVRDAGCVASAPLLPELLAAAARTRALRPAVVPVLGERGRWLAAQRPDWRRAVTQETAGRTDDGGPGGDGAGVSAAEQEIWRTGDRDERRGLLASLRRRDAAAGRELLAAGWAKETGEDRAALLGMLAHGLSAADEEFLETALDDRAGPVRDTARRLLGRLPGSAFRGRAAHRAAGVLRAERHAGRGRLVVTVPGDPDEAAVRDGLSTTSPVPGIGPWAWRLIQVLAAVPLAGWTARLGPPPAEIVRLPVANDLALYVRAGWRHAAVRHRGSAAELSEWVLALLEADSETRVNWPQGAWVSDTALAAMLPATARAERAAALLAAARVDDGMGAYALSAEVAGIPAPWPAALAGAVISVLARSVARPVLPPLPRALLGSAARCLPADGAVDYAAELTLLAGTCPRDWSALLYGAAETVALRRAFLAELR